MNHEISFSTRPLRPCHDPEYVLERSWTTCTGRGGISRSGNRQPTLLSGVVISNRYVRVNALFLSSPIQPV